MSRHVIIATMLAVTLIGCDVSEPKNFAFTIEGIKSISDSIALVSLIPQITKEGTYLVEIGINEDPFTGGAQDWNSVSSEVFRIGKALLAKPETVKIHFTFKSPQSNNFDWARVFVQRDKLPQNLQNLTYLEFFSYSEPLPGNIQASKWLCEFYEKYESSRPHGQFPKFCRIKD